MKKRRKRNLRSGVDGCPDARYGRVYGHASKFARGRKRNGVARVPIVALTAHALTGASAESLEAGCDGHLTKPVERNDLVMAIGKFAKRAATPVLTVSPSIAKHRPAFLENRRLDLIKMRNALAAGDFASIQVIGHNCKGTGVGYGFPEITTFGSAIEIAAKAYSAEELEKNFNDLEECIGAAAQTC